MVVHLFGSLAVVGGFGLFHQWINDVSLAPGGDLLRKKTVNALDGITRDVARSDRFAARRKLIDRGRVEIAVKRERERARDGSGGHHEHIGAGAFAKQFQTLAHTEPMLLVDDGEPKFGKRDVFLNKCVRADNHVYVVFSNQSLDLLLLSRRLRTGERGNRVTELLHEAAEI